MSNIKVAVRVRPPIERELRNGEKPVWQVRGNAIYLESGKYNAFHTFDHIFGFDSTNHDVYEKYCHPIVEAVMQGFNGTIFAFGQTSSGKTHTIMGNSDQPGLIPLTIKSVFNIIEKMPEREYLLRVSYMEIYNENILDLLDSNYGKHLQIRENADGQAIVVDLTEFTVRSEQEIEEAMKNGESRRHFGSTEANQRSSRSHAIFRMVVESSLRCDDADRAVSVGQLNLVDLAGSERSEQCGDSEERFRESTRINVSLTFLTQVISKLSRGERGHINFRDSKLTRILRNSLGGNAHTAIVCTVNPCCAEQTLRTLQFASSAKKIQNTPVANEIVSNTTLLCRYHKKIEELRNQIKEMEHTALSKTLQEKNSVIDELNNKVRQLQEKLVVSSRPAPSRVEWRRQRRETWAAPRTSNRSASPVLLPQHLQQSVPTASVDDFAHIFSADSRLSTVLEESESFQAMSEENFERVLQREERLRRSAVLPPADSILLPNSACTNASCAERITFLESEVSTLLQELEELKEMTKLERLLCSTSRRPGAPSDKPDAAEGTPTLQCGQFNACCVQTLLASSRRMDSVSRQAGNFFSPLFSGPTLRANGDDSATTVGSSPKECMERQCAQSCTPCAGLQSSRTVLWTPVQSPAVSCTAPGPAHEPGNTGTPQSSSLRTPEFTERATPASCLTNTRKETPTESVEVQTITSPGLSFVTAVEMLKCQGPVDKPVSGQLCFEQLVECGIQTEHIAECTASPGEQATLTSSAVQTSPLRESSALQEKFHVTLNAVVSCGVQAFPDVESCASQVNRSLAEEHLVNAGTETVLLGQASASQVNRSLAEEYCADTGTQAVTQVANCASQVDLQISRKQSTDCAVQCDADVQDREPQGGAAPDTADCGVQTTSSARDCATQTRHISHCGLLDCAVQAVPHMRDSATEPEEWRLKSVDYGVQTESSHLLRDKSTQSESCVAQRVSCEVQVAPLTRECASQVDALFARKYCMDSAVQVFRGITKDCGTQAGKSLAHDISCRSVSASSQFLAGRAVQTFASAPASAEESTPRNSSMLSMTATNGTPLSTSGSVKYQRFMRPGFNIFAPIEAEKEEQRHGDELAMPSHQKFFPFRNPAPQVPAGGTPTLLQQRKEKMTKAVGTQADILSVEELEKLRRQVSTMQTRLETHEKELQEKEGLFKLQEKAAKKKEIQLKALIRQMRNRDSMAEVSPVATRPRDHVERGPAKVPASTVFESPNTFSRRVRSLTPCSREAERLIYFGKDLEQQAIAEEVQLGQIRASQSSHVKQLESARKRLNAWTSRKSDIAHAVPRSPLKEVDLQCKSPAEAAKKEVNEMAYWPPMKYFLNPDPEDLDSP